MTDAEIRRSLTNLAGRWSPPGSDAAVDAGCTCPIMDNARGPGLSPAAASLAEDWDADRSAVGTHTINGALLT